MPANADAVAKGAARKAAKGAWEASSRGSGPTLPGEGDSDWIRLCWPDGNFDGDDPDFEDVFAACSERVLLPFLNAFTIQGTV